MKTELLNEYLFADLLRTYASREKVNRLRLSGESQHGDFVDSDWTIAFQKLAQARDLSLKLLAESASDSQ